MKKFLFFLCMLLSLGAIYACSGDDDDIKRARLAAQEIIIGKWILIRQGTIEIDPQTSNTCVEFFKDGSAKYEVGIGTETYHLIESKLEFEDDWTLSQDNELVSKLSGHIKFMIWGRGVNYDEPDRFACTMENNEKLYLIPDEGDIYFMDPTMCFIRIK